MDPGYEPGTGSGQSRSALQRRLDGQTQQATPDAVWDRFIANAGDGLYQQTTMWAQVKAMVGWQAERLFVEREGRVVGGCQLLIRSVPVVGAIAYAPRGPVVPDRDPAVLDRLLAAVHSLARKRRIVYLAVQPPPGRHDLASALEAQGFVESDLEIAPRATVRIDLQRSTDALFGAMRETTRRNVRKAWRLEVTVREGSRADLRVFRELLAATARRQGFSLYPPEYYEEIWRAFAAHGEALLLVAEHRGAVLAMHLLIGFGDTVLYKMGGWSGTSKDVHPNELLHWTGIDWARARGYRYYDFDDISLPAARTVLAGAELPPTASSLTRFKLRFGGDVTVFPAAHERCYPAALTTTFRLVRLYVSQFRPLADRVLRSRA